MGHLLAARCSVTTPVVQSLDTALQAAWADPEDRRITHLTLLDFDKGPRIGRIRAAIGIGWQARDRLRRAAEAAGREVDAVVEVCLCGHHHILAVGRSGVATVRWAPRGRETRSWLDKQAVVEGTELILEGGAPPAEEMPHVVTRILAALEENRRPDSPVPGPARGKA